MVVLKLLYYCVFVIIGKVICNMIIVWIVWIIFIVFCYMGIDEEKNGIIIFIVVGILVIYFFVI